MSGTKTLLIGVGNLYRRDDGVGCLLAQQLHDADDVAADVSILPGEGASLIAAWEGYTSVYLFDAVSSGARPGTVVRLDAVKEEVPSGFFNYSTHAFSVAEAIELARALDLLPDTFVIYGIEGERFDSGSSLTEPVRVAMDEVAMTFRAELGGELPPRGGTSTCTHNLSCAR